MIELKSSIVSIMSKTKEVQDEYLEPCQTSMNNYFAKTVNG